MKASLSLEFIGANTYDYVRGAERLLEFAGIKFHPDDKIRGGPWVADMTRDDEGYARPRWLYGKRDYSSANSKGSRGVYVHFVLDEGKLYWVQSPQSWRSTIRYYAAITVGGDVRRLSDEEAAEWLSAL